jgi:hypothetical protein
MAGSRYQRPGEAMQIPFVLNEQQDRRPASSEQDIADSGDLGSDLFFQDLVQAGRARSPEPAVQDDAQPLPRRSGSPEWNDEITHRQRVLLHALPLFRLHHADAIVGGQGGEFAHYDAFALAFRVFDLIIENTGLENEPETDDLARSLFPTLTAMDAAAGVDPDPERHQRMAERVLEWLLNEANHREPYGIPYTDFEGGEARRRHLEVRLVTERYMPGDRIVPRLSPEITNLYLSALDLTIEDQQIAVEAVMNAQIARGSFNEAVRSARQAHALSVRYREQLEAILRATRRDVLRVDWRDEVPALLHNAQSHIEERTRTERQIRQGAEDKLNALLMGSPEAMQLAEVIQLVDRCFQQHIALLGQLIVALPTFLDEQARQAFRPLYVRASPDLPRDVLEPFMALPQGIALAETDFLLSQFVPPRVPRVLSLLELVDWHFRPRVESRAHTVAVLERDLESVAEEMLRFTPQDWDRAAAVLEGVGDPVALSAVLAGLGDGTTPAVVRDLVMLRALFAFSPSDDGDADGLFAERSGQFLRAGLYHGDDLVLYRVPESEA